MTGRIEVVEVETRTGQPTTYMTTVRRLSKWAEYVETEYSPEGVEVTE